MTGLEQVEVSAARTPTLGEWLRAQPAPHPVAAMVVCALLVRMVVVGVSFRALAVPSIDHGQFGAEMGWVARSILAGDGFSSPFLPRTGPTALVPPLFPYLLSGVFRCFGLYTAASACVILMVTSVLSSLTCIPIYLSLRQAVDHRTATLAGWLWAFYPFAIFYAASQVWDYALTSLLFAICFCLAQRLHRWRSLWAWAGFGTLYGVTTLSNPSVLSILPFFLLIAVHKVRRVGGRWLLQGGVAVLFFGMLVLPWTARNYHVLHQMSPVRDGFWLEFWAGNDGDTAVSNPASAHPATNAGEMHLWQAQGESSYLAHKRTLSLEAVRMHPLRFVGLSARRAVRFWTGFWSLRCDYRQAQPLDLPNVFFCSFVTLFMLRGLARFWMEDPKNALNYVILLAVFPLVYYITHASMDYRQPVEPEIVSLVAVGIQGLRWRRREQGAAHDAADD